MFARKILQPFLLFFLFTVSLFLLLNILVSIYPDKFIGYFLPDEYELKIGKTNTAFLPFNAEFSEIDFSSDLLSFKLDKLYLKANISALLSSKPFLDITLENSEVNFIKEGGAGSDRTDEYKWTTVLKELTFSNINVKYTHPDFNTDVNIETLEYNGMSGKLDIVLGESFIYKNNIRQNFSGFFNGYIRNFERIDIQNALVNGKDFIVKISEGTVGKEKYYAEFSASLDSDFLQMVGDVDDGKVEINGTYEDGKISSLIKLTGLKKNNIQADGNVNVFGSFSSGLNLVSEDFVINDANVNFEGNIDPNNFNTYVKYSFPEKIRIFENKNYHVKIGHGEVNVTDNFRRFKTFNNLISEEDYSISADILRDGNTFVFKKLSITASGTSITGKGTYSNNTFHASLNGRVAGNKDLLKVLDFKHDLKIDTVINIEKNSWFITGNYENKIAAEIYNVPTEQISGSFNAESNLFSFDADVFFEDGRAGISGVLKGNTKNFDITLYAVPFNLILKYFNIESAFDKKVTGNAGIVLGNKSPYVHGLLYFNDRTVFPNHEIGYTFADNKLVFDYLNLSSYSFQNPGYIDFSESKLNIMIESKNFCYADFPEMKKLRFSVTGKLKNPVIQGSFITKPAEILEPFDVSLHGSLHKLTAEALSPGVAVNAQILPAEERIEGKISFDGFKVKDFVVNGESFFSSNNLKSYSIVSEDLHVGFRQYSFDVSSLQMMYENNEVRDISAKISNENIHSLSIYEGFLTSEKIAGDIILDDSKISIPYFDCIGNGRISFLYKYHDFPTLKGNMELKGDFKNTFADVRLKQLNAYVELENYSLYGTVKGKDVDTEISGKFFMDRYYDLRSLNADITARNLYMQKYGFRSSVDFNLNYNGGLNYLTGDVFINRGVYQHDENVNFAEDRGQNSGELPLNFNIRVKTREPVRLKSRYIEGGFNLALEITNKDGLLIEGSVVSQDSVITVGGGKFIVTKGYVRFIKNSSPFLYMEASGRDKFNYLRLNVKGFLPEYEIQVQSLDPSMASSYARSGTSTGSEQLMGKIFGGLLFKDIVSFTEKLIGINEINIETFNFRGEQGDFVSLGKRFSNRLQLRYMVGVSGGEEMNGVLGEYTLFDWMKLFVYTMPGGGTGAGFTFLNGF